MIQQLDNYLCNSTGETWLLSEYRQPEEQPTELYLYLYWNLLSLLNRSKVQNHEPDLPFPPEDIDTEPFRTNVKDGLFNTIFKNQFAEQNYLLRLYHHPVPRIKPVHQYLSLERNNRFICYCGNMFHRNHFPTYDTFTTLTLISPLTPPEPHRFGRLSDRLRSPNPRTAEQAIADWLLYPIRYNLNYPEFYPPRRLPTANEEPPEPNSWQMLHPRNKEIRAGVGFPYGFNQELYQGALENPNDHAYWLIFADHLEETGIYTSLMKLIRFFIGDPPP